MTLNLKLVRHQDGKWTALPPESDDLSQVSVPERKSAPIDPAQLLKALDSLLSVEGGIRSIEDVPRLASLMKKFSKKLVSRCVYCNVLQATKPEILSEYLDKGGWETINTWLQYAKTSSSVSFLIEMLKLCKQLPMTLNRLKENNTAKVIKSLTKHENNDIKEISTMLVNQWMSIIKDKKISESVGEKKKKKDKPEKSSKVEKTETTKEEKISPKSTTESPKGPNKLKGLKRTSVEKESKSSEINEDVKICISPKPTTESPKGPNKLKGLKRISLEKESKPAEIYEDVKIDPEPLMPVSKKPRTDRPKTAKIYQKKFRATGLEEETPLPKNVSKKTTTVDKTAAVAAAKNTLKLNTNPLDRITEKKIKPENLLAINENANTKGIKLIPAKPRPTYVLHESASFIDALISQPVAPIKRKKKVVPKPTTPQPTSPTVTAPKLQFYKDTLEEKMTEESKTEEDKAEENKTEEMNTEEFEKETDINKTENSSENASLENPEEVVSMDVSEEGGHTPPNEETSEVLNPSEAFEPINNFQPKTPFDPNHLQSILSHGRRRGKKKSVKWVDDAYIKEIFYFEMDDTERVNVSRNQNFYDLKSNETRREREAMELAKRQASDRVEELRKWWIVPILIDAPPPLTIYGAQSQEKHVEMMRQQSTLQEIYFAREMIPDSPHEPDLEIVAQKEPKVIPLDEENLISSVIDHSNFKPSVIAKTLLPEILTSLMKINPTLNVPPVTQNVEPPMQIPMEIESIQPPHLNIDPINHQNIPMSHNQPGIEAPLVLNPNVLSSLSPVSYQSPPEAIGPDIPGEWQGPPPDMPPNDFYGNFPVNQNMPLNPQHHPSGMNMRLPPNNFRQNFRPAPPRGMPPSRRNRKICRHFSAGHCRFEMKCTFLHPGINGPPL